MRSILGWYSRILPEFYPKTILTEAQISSKRSSVIFHLWQKCLKKCKCCDIMSAQVAHLFQGAAFSLSNEYQVVINIAVFRVSKDKNNPYVMVNKSFVMDANLSWKAKGILLYFLSRPDDWQIYESEAVKHSADGRDSFRSGIEELIAAGYIKRERQRDEKGMLRGSKYLVFEVSSKDGFSNIGKPTTTNNDLTNYINVNAHSSEPSRVDTAVIDSIKYYFLCYKNHTGKNHPILKREYWNYIYGALETFARYWNLDSEDLAKMMKHHFERTLDTDYNILHFATDGILINLMYQTVYVA